jgi:cell division protein FtsW
MAAAVFTYLKGDKVIWMIALILSLLSLISVYSFTPILTGSKNIGTESFLIKHVLMVFTGFILMFYVHNINYKVFSRVAQIGIWVAIILLFITLVAGVRINAAERWLEIPVLNIKFQTSDFAKVIVILFVARMLTVKRENLSNLKEGIYPIIFPVLAVCALIFPQNLSTAVLLFGLVMIMMFIGSAPMKYILGITASILLGVTLLFLTAKLNPDMLPRMETWRNRIFNHTVEDPAKQWQTNNALKAIDNGGLFGQGPGNGQIKSIIPEAYADFVYASFIEEFGSFGGGVLLLLYLILLYRCVRITLKSDSHFGSLLVIGLCLNLVFMAFVNMAVCTKLIPVTGQNMPLISMGGTSTWFTFISLGMILSVSRMLEEKTEEKNNKERTSDDEKVKEKQKEKEKQKGGDYVVA